ncbi:MAG: arsenite efflux transporter metallochaperone ArsD [Phycisphaerales bacterium]|nr:arsenite efflux transporter metallochaperone ArsD [Planctomycetota bacterium]MCH8508121.1 arsenite efflux transporter metallochaperone ArsD [Phycisphaerales bacterium]
MKRIEIFDPPMCCSTGVCGVEPDERLSRLAADLDWLRSRGVEVRRYNLAQEPMAFVTNIDVQRIVAESNAKALPVIVADGRVVNQGDYPSRDRLAELAGLAGGETTAAAGDRARLSGGKCCGGSDGCC